MTEITLFSAPKPFINPHIDLIQCNAIQSWLHLGEQVQVILVGEEPGLAKVAAEFSVQHLPEVARNEQGTPLVSSIFALARQVSNAPLMAYVNADILLLPDFLTVTQQVLLELSKFLLIGQRWDLEVQQPIDFSHGWQIRLTNESKQLGKLHPPSGSDYFIFPRTIFTQIPDFAIGRAGWDNWMIYQAKKQGWTVIDATPSLIVIHQNHDYSHLPGGKPHYDLEESEKNLAIAGGANRMYMVLDCDKQLINGKIRARPLSLLHLARQLETWLMADHVERRGVRWALARKLRRWRRRQTGSLI